MPRPPETTPQMSSIIPRGLSRRVGRLIERRLSLRKWDALSQFLVETRLVFSRAIVLLVGALFLLFAWAAIMENRLNERVVFEMLSVQMMILAILLNMNLWEVEREGRTFELLIMRIPNLNRLIWFKMRVSLFWLVVLALPFFAAYGWFVSIPIVRLLIIFAFVISYAVLVSFATSVVTSFVHHGLTAGVITFIVSTIVMTFFMNAQGLFYGDYYRLHIYPLNIGVLMRPPPPGGSLLTVMGTCRVLLINRLVLALAVWGFYAWLRRRLSKTEKWIL